MFAEVCDLISVIVTFPVLMQGWFQDSRLFCRKYGCRPIQFRPVSCIIFVRTALQYDCIPLFTSFWETKHHSRSLTACVTLISFTLWIFWLVCLNLILYMSFTIFGETFDINFYFWGKSFVIWHAACLHKNKIIPRDLTGALCNTLRAALLCCHFWYHAPCPLFEFISPGSKKTLFLCSLSHANPVIPLLLSLMHSHIRFFIWSSSNAYPSCSVGCGVVELSGVGVPHFSYYSASVR